MPRIRARWLAARLPGRLQDFNAQRRRTAHHAQLAAQQQAAADLALMLAQNTAVTTTENATVTFLREQARALADQIAGMPAPDEALQSECRTLLEAIDTESAGDDAPF